MSTSKQNHIIVADYLIIKRDNPLNCRIMIQNKIINEKKIIIEFSSPHIVLTTIYSVLKDEMTYFSTH